MRALRTNINVGSRSIRVDKEKKLLKRRQVHSINVDIFPIWFLVDDVRKQFTARSQYQLQTVRFELRFTIDEIKEKVPYGIGEEA